MADGSDASVKMRFTDARAIGVSQGCWMDVGARSADGFVSNVPRSRRQTSWREAVRHELRRSFRPIPFAFNATWSWEAGFDGPAQLLTSKVWFS